MPKYRIVIEYDGRPFVGWQRQDNGLGVQHVLELAAGQLTEAPVTVYGAGRTDAGVHASGQVAHLHLDRDMTAPKLMAALNAHLKPHPVAVVDAALADEDFHARFSAIERTYLYRIVNRTAPLTFDLGLAWRVPEKLDAAAMDRAGKVLLGKHDFTTFRASQCQAKSALKTLDQLDVVRRDDQIYVHARARSFLHHQVRNMVGTLRLVGCGKWTDVDVRDALLAKDRRRGGPTAPPDGLYLTSVGY